MFFGVDFALSFSKFKMFYCNFFFMPSVHEVTLKTISTTSPVSHLDRFLCTSKPTGLLLLVFFQLTVPVLRTSVSSGCTRQATVRNAYAKVSPTVVGTRRAESCWKRPKIHSTLRNDEKCTTLSDQ